MDKEELAKYLILIVCGIVIGAIFTAILFSNEQSKIDKDKMCFSLEEGDLRNGVLSFCKYVDEDCYKDFINWSGGKGLYWNNERGLD